MFVYWRQVNRLEETVRKVMIWESRTETTKRSPDMVFIVVEVFVVG